MSVSAIDTPLLLGLMYDMGFDRARANYRRGWETAFGGQKHERPARHRAKRGVSGKHKRTKTMTDFYKTTNNLSEAQKVALDMIADCSIGRGKKGYLADANGAFEGIKTTTLDALVDRDLIEVVTIATGRGGRATRRTARLTPQVREIVKQAA